MVIAHAMFKACLFMVVGIIDHSTGTRDIRKLAHLGKVTPLLAGVAVLAAASMAGLPPLIGFVAKEAALEGALVADVLPEWARVATTAGIVVGSILTLAYSIRFIWGAFGRKQLKRPSPAVQNVHAPGWLLMSAPTALAVAGLAAGLGASWIDGLVTPYADTLPSGLSKPYHLALWHGLTLPLGLTAVVIAGGTALFLAHRTIARLKFEHPPLGNADRMYDATLRGMDLLSLRLTAFLQRGSLPLTQATILVTLIVLPTALMFVFGLGTMPETRLWDTPWELAVGVIVAGAAITATVMRNRLARCSGRRCHRLRLGLLFAMHGAPDLALTQFLVETVTLVMFVLVLRKLPRRVRPGNRCQEQAAAGTARHCSRPGRHGHRCLRGRRAQRRPRSRCCFPTPPTTWATARTSSMCSSSTSAPGTPSVRSRCCWSPRPASPAWSSATRRFGTAPRVVGCARRAARCGICEQRHDVAARR